MHSLNTSVLYKIIFVRNNKTLTIQVDTATIIWYVRKVLYKILKIILMNPCCSQNQFTYL